MAPKGGGKGGGGGGGSSRKGGSSGCPQCTAPLQLYGYSWEYKTMTASFAIDCIVVIALLVCIIMQTRFKWSREQGGQDRLRNKGYFYGALSLALAYILWIVDLALRAERVTVVNLYYIARIFNSLFWRVPDILILAIIWRTIAESSLQNLARKLSALHKIILVILSVLSIVAFGAYTTINAYAIQARYSGTTVNNTYEYVTIAYQALYMLAALLVGVESVLVMLRARSKQTIILLTVVTPAFVLHSLFALVQVGMAVYGNHRRTSSVSLSKMYYDTQWACTFITDVTTIFIWVGVVLAGWFTYKKGARGSVKYVGDGAGGVAGTNYTPVSGWGK